MKERYNARVYQSISEIRPFPLFRLFLALKTQEFHFKPKMIDALDLDLEQHSYRGDD